MATRLLLQANRGTAIVVAFESAHDVGRVFIVGISVGVLFVEPCRGDVVGDRVHDILMERTETSSKFIP